jgi:very-short-patch-repair endonuclease
MEINEALRLCGGATRWATLARLGVARAELGERLADGSVVRFGRGAYGLPDAPRGLAEAAVLCGVASHATAAQLHGLATWLTPGIAVTVPPGSRRPATRVQVYRAAVGPDEREPWRAVTSVLRTVLDCGRDLKLLPAVCVIDSAVRAGLVDLPQLASLAQAARGPGSTALRCAVSHADELDESPLESVLRLLLHLGAGQVRSQVKIPGVGRVDFLVDGWLVPEADGFEFHADRESYRKDRRWGNALAARGLVLLRYSYEDLRNRPFEVAAEIEQIRRMGARLAAEHKCSAMQLVGPDSGAGVPSSNDYRANVFGRLVSRMRRISRSRPGTPDTPPAARRQVGPG